MFPGTSLKYIYNSPAFSDSPIVGDFSYGLSFPLSETNLKIFNFVNLPSTYEDTTSYECELYDNGIFFLTALFKIKSTVGKISGDIINTAYDFNNRIKTKTTKDLVMSDITRHIGTAAQAVIASHSSGYPEFHFAHFPVLNEILLDGLHPEIEEDWHSVPYINYYSIDPLTFKVDVLFPYLAYVIDTIFENFNIRITSNLVAQHPDLVKLCLINLFRDQKSPENYNLADSIAEISLEELLKGVNTNFGTCFFWDNRLKQVEMVYKKDLLESTEFVDWTAKVLEYPDKPSSETQLGYYLAFEFDGNDEIISSLQLPYGSLDNAVIGEEVNQPVNLPVYSNMELHAGEIRFVTCEQVYYIIVENSTDENNKYYWWTRLSWNFFGKKTKEASTEILSGLSPAGMTVIDPKRTIWLIPQINQKLFTRAPSGALAKLKIYEQNYQVATVSITKSLPRIVFYRGLAPNGYGENYPIGTSSHYLLQGQNSGSLSLTWDGDDGLYKNFHEKWLTWLETAKPFIFKIQLDVVDLIQMNKKRKIKIDSNFYLVKKIEIDLPIKKAASITMVRV
jgi:hypothetical protein